MKHTRTANGREQLVFAKDPADRYNETIKPDDLKRGRARRALEDHMETQRLKRECNGLMGVDLEED